MDELRAQVVLEWLLANQVKDDVHAEKGKQHLHAKVVASIQQLIQVVHAVRAQSLRNLVRNVDEEDYHIDEFPDRIQGLVALN